jgi:hypothetical protein
MTQVGVLSWNNENALTPYPLTKSFGYDSFLLDAQFIQFDNFVPTLRSITVSNDDVLIDILFDTGSIITTIPKDDLGGAGVVKKIYDGERYVAKLVFGIGADTLINEDVPNLTTKRINVPFLASTVRSIPTKAGVFSIADLYGAVELESDEFISYDVEVLDAEVTFNAISGFQYEDELYLKTLNLIGPTNNSVFLKDNQVIKIHPAGTGSIEISLVGTELGAITKAEEVIVTSG